MKAVLCTLILATVVVAASAFSPKDTFSTRSARTMSIFLEGDSSVKCPAGEMCCTNSARGRLEMCRWRDGICCGNLGFCCPSGTSCSSTAGRPHCVRALSGSSSPMMSGSGSSMPAPGPSDNSAESSFPSESGVASQSTGETKTTQSDGNTIILSNGNKITSVTRQIPAGTK